jgi:hypothetical protein
MNPGSWKEGIIVFCTFALIVKICNETKLFILGRCTSSSFLVIRHTSFCYQKYSYNGEIINRPRSGLFDIVRKNWLFCWNSGKNNDRGANKSLIIHKTSQNNRNNIIWSCIWVKNPPLSWLSDIPVFVTKEWEINNSTSFMYR